MKRWLLFTLVFVASQLTASEGMWTPAQLPDLAAELKQRGLQLDPRTMTDLTAHPMNAIISLGGCTASFVSPRGLAVTNHHCAYGAISYNSTEERNLLRDGFVAANQGEDVFAGPGSRILVTVEVLDVTDKVLGELADGLDGRARYQAIEDTNKALVRSCEEDEGHRCRVTAYHGGLRYELIKQLEIRDVRLVYAPPESVGKFGGDIDNWMWPRHTGDFSFYRAYVGPDGKPADPDEQNVPYQPRHWLRVQPRGVQNEEFVMVAGYPGRTNRYRMASEVANVIEWSYPTRKQAYENWLEVIGTATADRPEAALKYASLVAGLNNASKNYGGMLSGFSKGNLVQRKQVLEAELQTWIEADPRRQELFLSSIRDLQGLVAESQSRQQRDFFYGSLARRSSLLGAARTLYRLSNEQQKPDTDREPGYQERDLVRIRERLTRIDRTFDAAVDQQSWRHLILAYAAIPADQHVVEFDRWFGIQGTRVDEATLDAKLDKMYAGTSLADVETRLAWMDKTPEAFEASDDPFVQMAVALYESDLEREEQGKDLTGRYQQTRPQYMEALLAFKSSQGEVLYPDANSTLRVSVGRVTGSVPKDGMTYTPFTTLEGVVEKETGQAPFNTPPQLLKAIADKQYGAYVDERLGSVPVNYLTTLDTTGGNSGSPTLNGKAELVGLLFDGTYEGIIADWDFLVDKTRSICVDIRYVLWVMDQLGGAEYLLEEMGVAAAK